MGAKVDIKTPVVRYRQGTLLQVPFEIIRDLKTGMELVQLKTKERRMLIPPMADGLGWGATVEGTWIQLLDELLFEFERGDPHERTHGSWRPALKDLLAEACRDDDARSLWPSVREIFFENIDVLSGWEWCIRKSSANSEPVYRRDGRYLIKTEDGEMEIFGIKTSDEERLDYIAGAISSGLAFYCLKVLALINTERFCRSTPGGLPKSLRIVLHEADRYSYFLQWQWDVRWPYAMLPTAWRPDDNYCDPRWLANDLLAYIAEKEVQDLSPDISPPSPSLVERWNNEFKGTERQLSLPLDTRLNIGKESEAWIEFRGHVYRWINRTLSAYPILISTFAKGETDADVTLRSFQFMSHLAFQFGEGMTADWWAGSASSPSPSVSNPFREGYQTVPAEVFRETTAGKDRKRLDLALSLYREGVSSNSTFYRMLSFYKIIQLAFNENGKKIAEWVEANSPKMRGAYDDKSFQSDLGNSGQKVSAYLFEASRNAIAHVNLASGKEVVNPDNVSHHRRVNSALPLVQGLAKTAIDQGLF